MKVLTAICIGFALILGVQQYQLNKISNTIVEIQSEIKFITQSSEALVLHSEKDEACLARNIYYEAGIENENGKMAVAQVTLNRLRTGRWGNTICGVVYAKSQFSWTLKKKLKKPTGQAWNDSRWVAHRVLNRGDQVLSLKAAQFYHANYVSPKWVAKDARIAQVGTHIFYSKAKIKISKA